MLDRIVPVEDADVSAFLEKSLSKQGIEIMTGAGVEDVKITPKGITATIKDKAGKSATSDFTHVIVAIGIVPNTENIGLDDLVEMERGFIRIDPYGRTGTEGLWAIGDCTPGPWLAHKASHEGVTCAEAIAQELGNTDAHPHPLNRNAIPGCTYCHPQVASVGLTEAKAKEAGYEIKVGNFPFIGNGKAIALGEAEGFIKTVFDAKTGELLGAHMVGAEVTELIQGYTVGKTLETTEAELMQTVFPAPDLERNDGTKACSTPMAARSISEGLMMTEAAPEALKGEDWGRREWARAGFASLDRFEGMIAPIGEAFAGAGQTTARASGCSNLGCGGRGDHAGDCRGGGAGWRGARPRCRADAGCAGAGACGQGGQSLARFVCADAAKCDAGRAAVRPVVLNALVRCSSSAGARLCQPESDAQAPERADRSRRLGQSARQPVDDGESWGWCASISKFRPPSRVRRGRSLSRISPILRRF